MRILLVSLMVLFSACGGGDSAPDTTADSSSVAAAPGLDPTNAAGEEEGTVPSGWKYRFDRGTFTVGSEKDSVDVWFVRMTPGWHMTAKPAGIFWHPAATGTGNYTVSTKIHLFPPGERNEGYGLILGGANLEAANQSYIYFLIRRSGEFLIKRRVGSNTEELKPWTADPAIVPYTDETTGTTTNVLTAQVHGDMIHFSVNDKQVAVIEDPALQTDGIAGLRVNHSLNMHISEFAVTGM